MWESRTKIPHGRMSVRKYLLVATTLLVACFLYTFTSSTPVHAADAQLTGSGITYNGQTYSGPNTARGTEAFNLPKDTVYYVYTETAGSGNGGATPKAHLIYFAPGADPNTATQANYQTFDHPSGAEYTNPSATQTISVEQTAATNPTNAGGTTSCAVEGIGWIVCPVTSFLAKGMDIIYKIVSEFLVVRPLEITGDNAMYRAWSVMRNFANIAFVIAFMVVIYSQLTSIGLSNYSVKKLLPRVIVAAILVNTSYWICAVAIDICNILGYSLQDMFISIRNSLVGSEGNSWDIISWESISSFILSGGTIVAGAGIATYLGLAAVGGTVGITGLIFLLLPLLLSVLFVVLMTFLILAARQAIITILVVLAPLAFVAYLLPNTEKWFEKWRSTLFTLLLVFPGFSLIFGGSQLAASIIIQNANSINMILLAMAVQVMPLAITPLLLKLGGGVLNRFAGIVNNPTKGMFDRGKAWSKERLEANQAAKMKRLAENPAAIRRISPSRVAYARNQKRRRREAWKAANEATADGHWKNTAGYQRIQQRNLEANQIGDAGESLAQAAYNRSKITDVRVQNRDITARLAKLDVDVTDAEANVQWENLRAGESADNIIPAQLAAQALHARTQTREGLVAAQQLKAAQHEQQQDFARALRGDEFLQARAGGISEHGADAALAAAIATERQAYGKSVEEARQIVKHFNLSSEERQDHALGRVVVKTDGNGNTRAFNANNIFTREAVIEDQIATGTVEQAEQLVALSGSQLAEFRTTISDAVAKSGLGGKTVYLGGATINEIAKGNITSEAKLVGIVQDNIAKGKFSPEKLAGLDKDAAKRLVNAIRADTSNMDPNLVADYTAAVRALSDYAADTLRHRDLKTTIPKNALPYITEISDINAVNRPLTPEDE